MTTIIDTHCAICHRASAEKVCTPCHDRLFQQLDDLLELWSAAHDELLPGKSGNGGRSSEQTIGLNVAALSFIAGDDILHFLHDWERIIRADRELTPPAFLRKRSLVHEIADSVAFHRTHLGWSITQPWIDDYARELRTLHGQGIAAARRFVQKVRRIACPSDTAEGLPCGNLLALKEDDILQLFDCRRCHAQWSTYRLIAVALADPRTQFWLDAEAIGAWLNLSVRRVQQIAKEFQIAKKGSLYDLKALLDARSRILA